MDGEADVSLIELPSVWDANESAAGGKLIVYAALSLCKYVEENWPT
jgi:hypothetical protein